MTHESEITAEALLEHATWMRRLALGLVRDPAEADDVVQEATLAALAGSPPGGSATRPWLATVVRNFAWRRRRSEVRRRDHEERAARRDRQPSHVETLERIDLQRSLLDRVRTLDEPLRTTVVQRYFEGRTSAEIARLADVPAATVRARLKRAIELLRTDLDREFGSRGAWLALIAPFVPAELAPVPPESDVPTDGSAAPGAEAAALAAGEGASLVTGQLLTQGALIMMLAKVALPTALAALVAFAAWTATRPQAAAPSAADVALPAVVAVAEPAPAVPDAASARTPRSAVTPAVAAADDTEPAADVLAPVAGPLTGSLDARFVDEDGAPWPGIELAILAAPRSGQDRIVAASGRSDANGSVSLEAELPRLVTDQAERGWRFDLIARHPDCVSRRLSAVLSVGDVAHLGDVAMSRGARVRGRAVDARGVAVANARVGAVLAADVGADVSGRRDAIARVGDPAFDELLSVRSRSDGSFEIAGVAPGRVRLWASAPDLRHGLSEPFDVRAGVDSAGREVVLGDPRPTDRVAGQVVGPDGIGRPASLKRVTRVGDDWDMSFEQTDAEGRFEFPVEDLAAVYELTAYDGQQEYGFARVEDVRPGDRAVVIAFSADAPLLVRVRDSAGEPVAGAQVAISTLGSTSTVAVEVRAPGDYVVQRPSGSFHVEVRAPGFREARSGPFDEGTTPAAIDVTLEAALRITGQVLADGAPVAGATVEVFVHDASGGMTVNGLRCTIQPFGQGSATTGSDGRFALSADVDDPFVVRASHADWTDAEVGPLEPHDDLSDLALELSTGGALAGTVLVSPGETAGGRVVVIHRGDGRARSVRSAPDGSYRFDGLVPGDWLVTASDTEIDPFSTHFSGYSGDEPMAWSCRVSARETTRYDLDLTGE